MCTITGTIKSTPLPWLPVISNITPPYIRRRYQADSLLQKVQTVADLPLAVDLRNPPERRLKSRCPPWDKLPLNTSANVLWREEWDKVTVPNKHLVDDRTKEATWILFEKTTVVPPQPLPYWAWYMCCY